MKKFIALSVIGLSLIPTNLYADAFDAMILAQILTQCITEV